MTGKGNAPKLRIGACLSLSGQFARFGTQAADALRVWAELHGNLDLLIEDDESSKRTLENVLPEVAAHCDVLLGPYSTQLARRAAQLAAQEDWLLWNQGGSGDDIETNYPRHCLSILTPTSRYADPYLRLLTTMDSPELGIVAGIGSFGRHITGGARGLADDLGISVHVATADEFAADVFTPGGEWHLLSVGRFEDDIDTVLHAQTLTNPPRSICAIAAGVHEFGEHVADSNGILGIAQWFPGDPTPPTLGPAEADFLRAYVARAGATPDYPAIQAVAGAIIAEHCAVVADSTGRAELWTVATSLDARTLFGEFRIDPATGAQEKHSTALLQWNDQEIQRHTGTLPQEQ
jgi:ABC-type branched-subunit amino acid transport system substrate-binding protein